MSAEGNCTEDADYKIRAILNVKVNPVGLLCIEYKNSLTTFHLPFLVSTAHGVKIVSKKK